MFSAKRFWGAVTSVVLAAAGLVATASPAHAYATAPTLGSGAASDTVATSALFGLSTGNNSQVYAFNNMHGGTFEIGGTADNSKSITIRSYVNGVLDANFNGTGIVTFNGQLFNNTGGSDPLRNKLDFTTYANGTKWMALEINSSGYTGVSYLHLGTYAAGYQSTLTIPNDQTLYSTCQSWATSTTYTTTTYGYELIRDSPYSTPNFFVKCGVNLTAAPAGYSWVYFIASLTGGTTLGTAGTLSSILRVSPFPTVASPTQVMVGYSTNPNAVTTTPAVMMFTQLSAGTTTFTSAPTFYSTTAFNGYVIITATANNGSVTRTSAWTPTSSGSYTGTIYVAPRNDGTVKAITMAGDGTTNVFKLQSFGTTGIAAAPVTLTGTLPTWGGSILSDVTAGSTTVKFASNDGTNVKGYEIAASTAVSTAAGSFSSGNFNTSSIGWAGAATSSGTDFYGRTAANQVTRVSMSSAPTAPATATAPTATRGDGQVSLSWTAPSDGGAAISSYSIRYSSDSGSTWTTWGSNPTTTSETITGLTNGISYLFQVAATNSVGTAAWSPSSTAAIPASVPTSPSGLAVTGGDAQLSATWSAPTGNGGSAITDYQIEYSSNGGTSWTTWTHTASTATSATITGLTNGNTYLVRVSAVNAVGAGSAQTLGAGVLVATAPGAPTSVTGTRGDSQVALSWTAPASDGGSPILVYGVEYSSNSGANWSTFSTTSATTSLTVTGLTNGTAYIFRVTAGNIIADSSPSASSIAYTPAALPGSPSLPLATRSGQDVTLNWNAPGSTGGFAITDYLIEYSTNSGSTWNTWTHTASTATTATLTSLPFATYKFRVSAVTSVGTGGAATGLASVLVAIAPGVPAAPTLFIGNTQLTANWVAPAANGCAVTAYTLQYSADSGSTWLTWSTSLSGTSATVTGLTNGTAYIMKLAATNCSGTSSFSSASLATAPNPVPAQIGSVVVTGSGSNTVALSWVAPASTTPITDYVIEYSTDGGSTWVTYSDGVSTTASATITGLTTGLNYSFRVSAVSSAGSSSSSSATTAIAAATVPGAQAAAPTTSATYGVVAVSWTAPASNGGSAITAIDLQYSTNGGTTWQTYAGAVDLSGTIAISGLTGGQAYVFRTRTNNFFGPSAWSTASASVTALAPIAPAAVSSVAATPGSAAGTVNLSWTAPAANGSPITDYVIEYSIDGGVTWQTYAHPASSATSATLTGLVPGGTYAFRVSAVNGVGTATASTSSAPTLAAAVSAATDISRLPTNIKVDRAGQIVANGSVTFQGNNLGGITQVLMNGWESIISNRTADSLTAKIPTQVIGWVNVEFVSKDGRIRYDHVLFVNDAKAPTIAVIGVGFVASKSGLAASSVRTISTSQLALRSINRVIANSAKFSTAKAITCLAYVGKGMRAKDALARAKATCALLSSSAPKASVKLAITRTAVRAHVLALFQY